MIALLRLGRLAPHIVLISAAMGAVAQVVPGGNTLFAGA